ncbi:hypothetical protein B0A48_18111 [Cryoendolithus antarcticus]|uniref:Metallo-beta-lactamase domain-containing protein n=1 Tax=Cryoendolithus antarcticus TaxID=1507870 RepID=A0A1V8S9L1_9PEZI|nr:hypothetical protein B0A48_18111 [Cryoendolithus antarcticus]
MTRKIESVTHSFELLEISLKVFSPIELQPTEVQDPRQFIPPTGQSWTSHSALLQTHHNVFKPIDDNKNLVSIVTEPKFGIGQRCILVCTPQGNILWDCITLLDQPTIDFVNSKGRLKGIVISHPHYYTRHIAWAAAFQCPVYISAEDASWVQRSDPTGYRRLIDDKTFDVEIIPGVRALKLGGHFPGSLVLTYQHHLFVADTIVTVPSGLYARDRPPGTTSFAFMWSIINMIPLPPKVLFQMWMRVKHTKVTVTHGAFVGQEVRDTDGGGPVMKRILESMKIQVRACGWSTEESQQAERESGRGWDVPDILGEEWL